MLTPSQARIDAMRRTLLSSDNSRRNKRALIASYLLEAPRLLWLWRGQPYRSRLAVSFNEGASFQDCKSFDEDVLPLMKDMKDG